MQIHTAFPSVTKETWLAQVSKDLKGAPLDSLHWQVSEGINANPLVDNSDLPPGLYPLSESPNNWEISENIAVNDPVEANAQALLALQAGAEGICFTLYETPTAAMFATLLHGIYLDFVGLHFEGAPVVENPGLILALLAQIAASKEIPTTSLRGSLNYAPTEQATFTDWRYLAELVELTRTSFPGIKVVALAEATGAAPEQALASLLAQANLYMTKLTEAGVQPHAVAASLQFVIQVGPLYFVEIARLRALEILWLNWSTHWQIPLEKPFISAVFNPNAYDDAIYTNMIKATTMAMSAALGGAQRITVCPYDEGREQLTTNPKAFARRIARNVQHLLKLESGLHTLTDPAAGSYYIEHLTHQMANAAWAIFTR